MQRHPDVTDEAIAELCERAMTSLDNPGMCLACGAEAEGVEPDARRYVCDFCGARQVYGCEELALMFF